MSKDIIRGTLISVTGVGLYGLYYGWKVHRNREFLKSETEVTLSPKDRVCIAFLLDTETPRLILNGLLEILKKKFAYDICKLDSSSPIHTDIWKDYTRFREYFAFITRIKTFHDLHKSNNNSIPFGDFLGTWGELFEISYTSSSVENSTDKEYKNGIIRIFLHDAEIKLRTLVDFCILSQYQYDTMSSWASNELSFGGFLKDKKCINIDLSNDDEREGIYWLEALRNRDKIRAKSETS